MNLKMTIGVSLVLCGPAMAQDVYPGCEAPTTVAGRHTFFVDPVKGSNTGDGSMSRPWKDLNTVLASASKLIATKSHKTLTGSPLAVANPAAPIKGGDIIMLMSGNHGDVTLQNAFNDKFISIMPAPGQKPIIQHLKISGAARWAFQGLIFQSEYPSGSKPNSNALVLVQDGWGDSTQNITFEQDTFQTTADASGWSDQDWFSKPNYVAIAIKSTCVAITNSTINNVMNGVVTYAPKTLLQGNIIDKYSNDAIDGIAGSLTIVGNTITNSMYNTTSSVHPDMIQIWAPLENGKLKSLIQNVKIDSNKLYTPKGTPWNGTMGVSCTACENSEIVNNAIVANHWNALVIDGSKNSKVLNNTVMSSDPDDHPANVIVKSNAYSKTTNLLLRNNVSQFINIYDSSVTSDHNVAGRAFNLLQGGKQVWTTASNSATKNLVLPTSGYDFRDWNPSKDKLDVHIKAASALAGKGSSTSAPSFDADGRTRAQPMDLGAFSR